jgi:RNA polymerase sigma-70 factor (ECF subfamily)
LDDVIERQLIALLPQLRRFARGLTGTVHDADDLVQIACERAVGRIDQWQPGTRLDSWMYRIVQNAFIDFRRSETSRRNRLDAMASDVQPNADGEAVAEAHVTLDRVREFFGELPDDQVSVVLLVCVEGFSYRETADILEIPTGTVMSRLARARRAIGEHFDDGVQQDSGNRKLN